MNTEATLLTGKVETPKRALALQLGLAVCGLTALVAALATPRASGPQATGLRGAADANLATFTSHATVDPSGGPLIEVLRTDCTSEQNIVKTIENGVSLEISETADAICGCDLQTLTPLQYANLARLGHDLAAEPLAQLVEARAAATRRKSSPAAALIGRKRAEASECADCPLLSSRF